MESFNRRGLKYGIILGLLLTLLISSLAGCGKSYDSEIRDIAQEAPYDYSASSDSNGMDIMYDEAAKSEEADYGDMAAAADMERKVIQNAYMNLEVNDVSKAMDSILKICQDNQGYTVSSNLSRGDEWVHGEVNIKVPADSLSGVMEEITALGDLADKNISSLDVTEEYYDSQARLTVLNKKEERLLLLIDQAQTIDEIIAVENELTRVRSDIETLQGRLKYLENSTSYSSVSVSLRQAAPGSVEVPEGVWGRAVQSFINSLNGVAQFLTGLFILLIAFIPWAILLALFIWIIRTLMRKYNWKIGRKNKRNMADSRPSEDIEKKE